MSALYTLATIAALWLYLVIWFFAVGTYLRMENNGSLRDLPTFLAVSLRVVLYPGLVVDALFNLTYGVIHYRVLPRDFLFSGTTERILREGSSEHPAFRIKRAERWAKILNSVDPGHISP